MKILFPYMARWKAVNWTRYHQLFTRLAKMGHDVYVLQPPAAADLIETNFQEIEVDLPEKLHLIDVKLNQFIWKRKFPFNKLFKKGYYCFAAKRQLKQIAQEYKIDVLFVYNIPQYPLLGACDCFKIFDFADDYREMLKHELGRFSNEFTLNIADFFLKKMIDNTDLTLTVSHSLADLLKKNNNVPVEVIPNGADLDDFNVNPALAPKLECKGPVVGFVGSFEYFIDFDLILGIAKNMPEITFLLVGSGRDSDYVKNKIKTEKLENVILTGSVAHHQIAYYIEKMDICLNIFKKIPVSHNACPLKLFEYLIMKKPVISNRLAEIERIDRKFVFYADTVAEFTTVIKDLLENKKKAKEFTDRGYAITLKEYTWQSIVEKFLSLVKNASKD